MSASNLFLKRLFDVFFALLLSVLLAPLILVVALLVYLTSGAPVLYWSDRAGQFNKPFRMPKFRTMKTSAPLLATDQFANPEQWLTPAGSFLRRSSLDELPQLWSILKGDMSFVGPRPALPSQVRLCELRQQKGVDRLKPGLTGWAQVNGRDTLGDEEKAKYDYHYLQNLSPWLDFRILLMTFVRVVKAHDVTH